MTQLSVRDSLEQLESRHLQPHVGSPTWAHGCLFILVVFAMCRRESSHVQTRVQRSSEESCAEWGLSETGQASVPPSCLGPQPIPSVLQATALPQAALSPAPYKKFFCWSRQLAPLLPAQHLHIVLCSVSSFPKENTRLIPGTRLLIPSLSASLPSKSPDNFQVHVYPPLNTPKPQHLPPSTKTGPLPSMLWSTILVSPRDPNMPPASVPRTAASLALTLPIITTG